ncbi:MAG TPA: TetR/AcrR family transcriptional regulator [Candidatus Nanopelagicaceae bacterium]|jgi:AcrR family transcriptional regulator
MANTDGPTRQKIRVAAYELLKEKGVDGLSMRALADRLHIKAPSLYKHVQDKDEIVADLQARGLEEFGAAIKKAGKSKRAKALTYRKWALENPHLYEITVSIPLLRDRIPAGLEDGVTAMIIEITGKDHEQARAVWALMHGLVDLEIAGRFPKDANLDLTWKRAIAMI